MYAEGVHPEMSVVLTCRGSADPSGQAEDNWAQGEMESSGHCGTVSTARSSWSASPGSERSYWAPSEAPQPPLSIDRSNSNLADGHATLILDKMRQSCAPGSDQASWDCIADASLGKQSRLQGQAYAALRLLWTQKRVLNLESLCSSTPARSCWCVQGPLVTIVLRELD
ncbi:uncharacterized protein EI97DRAFT_165938 [Westerdykella ornata]|uniref:Uncharacterized protein n=1 Tax=Westerdykella ornata TaxID=318751 RepID=A0A6A6JAA8_WESOR|nr:uncharacterized protein EI97DRAFT_165938 [Westerdykella ornata]KAF2273255.1 hypothetical protein EI97DRAFT_165938 [Westerdykella ornata]